MALAPCRRRRPRRRRIAGEQAPQVTAVDLRRDEFDQFDRIVAQHALAPEHQPLPWSETVQFFLRQAGPALLPTDRRLDVPARWHDEMVARLAASHGQSLPLLILPVGERLEVTGLAEARALTDIDLARLAGEARS